jgi:hypothetical protein
MKLQESDFGLPGYMSVSACFFPMLYDHFEKACETVLAEEDVNSAVKPT